MRTRRKELKKTRSATIKSLVQSARVKQFEDGINPDDFSRFESEGGSSESSSGILAVEVYLQPANPVITPPIRERD